MLVRDRMTPNPVTVTPETTFPEAFRLMREHRFRRLPVVDKKGRLVGIVVEKDMLHASPSAATSLSVFEINYLLSKLKVEEVMTSPVITVEGDLPVEEAARVMVEHKIGSLPVMDDGKLVGIITETDIFKLFVEILGGGECPVRITIRVPDTPGQLARATSVIASIQGNIHAIGSFKGDDPEHLFITMRIEGAGEEAIRQALQEAGIELVNVWVAPCE